MNSIKIFGISLLIVAYLSSVKVEAQNATNITSSTTPTPAKNASMAITVGGSSSTPSTTKKADEEDCQDDAPIPEPEGNFTRQGKELNLNDKDKYVGQPEPESEPGQNGTSAGSKDKLTANATTSSTRGGAASTLAFFGSSCACIAFTLLVNKRIDL